MQTLVVEGYPPGTAVATQAMRVADVEIKRGMPAAGESVRQALVIPGIIIQVAGRASAATAKQVYRAGPVFFLPQMAGHTKLTQVFVRRRVAQMMNRNKRIVRAVAFVKYKAVYGDHAA